MESTQGEEQRRGKDAEQRVRNRLSVHKTSLFFDQYWSEKSHKEMDQNTAQRCLLLSSALHVVLSNQQKYNKARRKEAPLHRPTLNSVTTSRSATILKKWGSFIQVNLEQYVSLRHPYDPP